MIDNRPGGLDGPPRPSRASAFGALVGAVTIAIALTFTLVAMVWGIAWMVTHFPGA